MNLEGWEIDVEALPGPQRGESPVLYFRDSISPSPTGRYAVLLYTIWEHAMGWEIGQFALYTDREHPRLLVNPKKFGCMPSLRGPVLWLTDTLFAVPKYYYDTTSESVNVPFLIIDIPREQYSFIPLVNACPYSIAYDGTSIQLDEQVRDTRFQSRDGQSHNLANMNWFPFSRLEDFNDIYRDSLQFE